MKTFEEFLDSKYDEIDNDSNNMNDAFEGRRNTWYENLDIQEVMNYAEEWGQLQKIEGKAYVLRGFEQSIEDLKKLTILK